MSFYNTKANADNHPFVIAYNKCKSDMEMAASNMRINRLQYDTYVMEQTRLIRLQKEQQQLLSIMADDLTSDIIIEKLSK